MKTIGYVGIEGTAIVIERPSDIYALIDWFQSEMMERVNEGKDKTGDFEKCANFCTELMDTIEEKGLGSFDDVENVKYG